MAERLVPHETNFFDLNYTPEAFTPEEQQILSLYFSNNNRPVFIASGLPEGLVGALISRHSQAEGSMRRVFLDEFVKDRQRALAWSGSSDFLDLGKANGLLEKFFGLGHDSLAATVPLIIGFEGISQLGVKAVEDTRIGLSPIERSTRYGSFGRTVNGCYLYSRPPGIMSSQYARLYEQEIDANLDLYNRLQGLVAPFYYQKFPTEGEGKIKRRVFDVTRILLVAANQTNFGVLVNGQAAENLMIKLGASSLTECREMGQMLQQEIGQVCPALVSRLQGDFGPAAIDHLRSRDEETRKITQRLFKDIKPAAPSRVALLGFDSEGTDKVIARILWPDCELTAVQVSEAVERLSAEEKQEIINGYLGERPDRRVKVGRAFEEVDLEYQVVLRFAEWRDLQRNRILTPFRRRLDYSLGVDIYEDLEEFGFGDIIRERLGRLAEAHAKIAADFPDEAQYLVAFGALMPYIIKLNFRELVHIAELRTGPGTHPGYAKIASEMARMAANLYPLLAPAFKFVHWQS